MGRKDINKLKLVLVEQKHTAKWLAEQVRCNPASVSKWCTNTLQPNFDTLCQVVDRDTWSFYSSRLHDYTAKYWHIADAKTSSVTHILGAIKVKWYR